MEPIYTPHNTKPAYQLNWGLTVFWRQTPLHEDHWLAALQQSTEPDGVRILNLHLVIVNEERWMEIRDELLDTLSTTIELAADKHGERLSRVAIVPDHIHLTMGCPIERSPEQIALGYLNNCAYACGMKALFHFGYYVGTFGEYDRGAVE